MTNSCISDGEILALLNLDTCEHKSNASKQITERLLLDFNKMTQQVRSKDQFIRVCLDIEKRWHSFCDKYKELDWNAFRFTCHQYVPHISKDLPIIVK